MELDKRFDFKSVDAKWTKKWEDDNVFHASSDSQKPSYVIVIPPPNVTGILHMGHALNNTLQDIMIRYKRMNGFEACWMPGTDHAGIATQNVVEKQLAKEGTNRHDVGREALLERLWAWKQDYGDTIINQLKRIGASCDWSRTRFTMDEGYSEAVLKVFIELYRKGLIYRGERIINWCPRCLTALSDEEAEHNETQGNLYYFKYPVKDQSPSGSTPRFVTVATTRPETMLGDTAVAVNPNDERYKDLIGRTLILPLVNREIPVIADEFVDPEFGTGCVKVTPAHDPNDFEMGQRHNLPIVNVMNDNATMNENAGEFSGQDRFEAREAIVDILKEQQLCEKIEAHTHAVGHCYRCHTVVEPRISKQWFVKMKPLAEPALAAVKEGKIRITPERWEKVYCHWMENIRDWCISRQIWWGHRIPVWYDEEGKAYAAMSREEAQTQAGPNVLLAQDDDVLDTWFSSWLWPFATFGWPQTDEQSKKDVQFFYPGDALFTASEIIFFWVARMVMAGIEFQGDIPFRDVYIHGTVRDAQGRKMSKSLGNAIDPLEIVEEYGADALRYSLIINSGDDLYISKDKFEIGRNFANKIWNASRLILMNTQSAQNIQCAVPENQDLPSRWILSRFHSTLQRVATAIEGFRFSEAESLIYEFFWNNFCDWYLEIIKDKWSEPAIQSTAIYLLKESLKMMHPFIPFVTEEIWEKINPQTGDLCLQDWPKVDKGLIDEKIEGEMRTVMDMVVAVRNIRAMWHIKNNEPLSVTCEASDGLFQFLETNGPLFRSRANIKNLNVTSDAGRPQNAAVTLVNKIKIIVPLGDVIDVAKEKQRILNQLESQKKSRDALAKRLQNENFVSKAPRDIVTKEKERLKNLDHEINELEQVAGGLN